jgi:anti-sigma factor (TIGR02949 family)
MTVLTCADAVKRFFAYLDRALAGEALDELEAHLEACLDCCDKLAFGRELDAFVKSRLLDSAVPSGLEARLRRRLAQAAGES